MVQTITQHDCKTATEFVAHLRPGDPLWQPYPEDWIFRGQWDSTDELSPSAFRRKSWCDFVSPETLDVLFSVPRSESVQAQQEYLILRDYFKCLDRAGIEVPNEIFVRNLFDHWGIADSNKYDHRVFMTDKAIVTFAALAQHHGVPTRLLDWTRSALRAAYFAAVDAAPHVERTGTLSVWALTTAFTDNVGARPQHQREHVDLRILTAPRGSNPNLHAQSGLFSVWFAPTSVLPLEKVIEQILETMEWKTPPLHRLTLAWSEAPQLLRLLADEQIDGAHMFPGRDGVVRFMKEKRLWDRRD